MRKGRVSGYKQERLLEMFIAGATARTAADLIGVHRNMAAYYFHRLSMIILDAVKQQSLFDGEIELIDKLFWRSSQRQGRAWCIRESAGIWDIQTGRQGLYKGYF